MKKSTLMLLLIVTTILFSCKKEEETSKTIASNSGPCLTGTNCVQITSSVFYGAPGSGQYVLQVTNNCSGDAQQYTISETYYLTNISSNGVDICIITGPDL